MTKSKTGSAGECPVCGKLLAPELPAGLCPTCLLSKALKPGSPASDEAPTLATRGADQPSAGEGTDPSLGDRRGEGLDQPFGDYEIVEEIGRGGMGVVYRARQRSLGRDVALKMILAGRMAGEGQVKRLRAEAEAAARLQHPHIVTVHEVGEHDGRAFFSMDLIAGQDLGRLSRAAPLPPERAALYLKKVAGAVEYAHRRGVIHRDLKPQNILIDASDEPRITDFGLAKRTDRDDGITLTGELFGSPGYMAPEQAKGAANAVGPRADVYALGAILYELLTGRPPFRASTPLETLRQVAESDPAPPRSLNPAVPPDLETICLKCLEKEPTRRYESAQELADELDRHLRHEPIRASRAGLRERAVKWARRNPVMVGMSGLVMIVAVIGFAGVVWQLRQTRAALALANLREVAEATARAPTLPSQLTLQHEGPVATVVFSRDGRRLLTASHDHTARLWDSESGELQLTLAGHEGVVGGAMFSPQEDRVLTFSFDTQFRYPHLNPLGEMRYTSRTPRFSDQTARVWDVSGGKLISVLQHPDQVVDARFSPDGQRVLTGGWDGAARIWDATTGAEEQVLKGHAAALLTVDYTVDGERVVTSSSGYSYRLTLHPGGGGGSTSSQEEAYVARVWDPDTGAELTRLPNRIGGLLTGQRSSRCRAAFSPDGTLLVMAAEEPGNTAVWNARTGKCVAVLRGLQGVVNVAHFSHDGRRVVTGGIDHTARIWDARSGRQLAKLAAHEGSVLWAEFSPDDTRVVTASADGTARVWDASNGVGLANLKGHGDKVYQARFSPDGWLLATASEDGTVRVWPAATMEQLSRRLEGHRGAVVGLDFSPDNTRVVSASNDGTARLWEVQTGNEIAVLRQEPDIADPGLRQKAVGEVVLAAFDPAGSRVVTVSEDHQVYEQPIDTSGNPLEPARPAARFTPVRVWDGESGTLLHALDGFDGGVSHACFSATGRFLLTVPDGRVRQSTRRRAILGGGGWSGGSTRLPGPFSVKVWDPATGELTRELPGHESPVQTAAFSPDETLVATVDRDQVRVWELLSGRLLARFDSSSAYGVVEFSKDSRRLLAHDRSGGLTLTDAQTGEALLRFAIPGVRWKWARLSPEEDRVIALSQGGEIVTFDIGTGAPLNRFGRIDDGLTDARLSADGRWLVGFGSDQEASVWDAALGERRGILKGHKDVLSFATFSPDSQWLGTASRDFTLRLWPMRLLPRIARTSAPEGNSAVESDPAP